VLWINACSTYILKNGYPFSGRSVDSMSNSDLEYKTYHAFDLASWWISGLRASRHTFHVDATSSTFVHEVRFIPGHAGEWILTLSKGIWDIMTVWGLHRDGGKLCEWSPRGAFFKGMSLNSDSSSNGTVAISMFKDGEHHLEILSLGTDEDGTYRFRSVFSMESQLKPTKLHGDLLAISDDLYRTEVWNWRLGTSAILKHTHENDRRSQVESP
jgi:hypothetical protein